MKKVLAVVMFGVGIVCAFGADDSDVIVSATRVASSSDSVASSVTVISADDIARKNKSTAIDLLRDIPGIHVVQNGGAGMQSHVIVRGAQTEQTLVVVDGVELNDPISAGRASFLSNLDVENIERIEVVRGSQSSLYGSDALAGVINIVTKKGSGTPSSYLSVEGGSYNTFREAAGISGSHEGTHYSLAVSRFDTDGISAANEKDGNTEKDSAEHSTVSARIGRKLSDAVDVDLVARYIDSESEFDNGGGAGNDAEGNISTRESFLTAVSTDIDLFDSTWRQKVRVTSALHDRTSKSTYNDSTFDSSLLKAEWQNDIYHGDGSVFTVGIESEAEEGETDSIAKLSSDTVSLFAQEILNCGDLTMAVGVRWDDRDDYGDETTYRIAPLYKLGDTGARVKGTYGTGFKTPSLYQLYAPESVWGKVGNPDLKPETSEGWDLGVEQRLNDGKARCGITYFSTEYEDMIDFESGYVNKSEIDISGVELHFALAVSEDVALNTHYTYLDARDISAGKDVTRRPENRVFAEFVWQCMEKASVTVGCLYVDDRPDRFYDPTMLTYVDTTLDEYFLVNLAASYDVNDNFQIFGRVDNVLDEEYEEVTGYGTPGISGYAGVKVTL